MRRRVEQRRQRRESGGLGEILTEASAADSGTRLRDHFDLLKGWNAGACYSSEIGMRGLRWTGAIMFAEFQGCPHPERHGNPYERGL